MKSKSLARAVRKDEARKGPASRAEDAFASPEESPFETVEGDVFRSPDREADAFATSTAASAVGLLPAGMGVAAKLEVSDPGDELEREADRVAEEVTGSADERPVEIHRAAAASSSGESSPAATGAVSALRGGGSPLPESARSFFEPRLGVDLGGVRVHAGPEAATAAKSIKAQAFTYGRDIAFGEGKWSPDTPSGRKLLAHELAHVGQSSIASRRPLFRQAQPAEQTSQEETIELPAASASLDESTRAELLVTAASGWEEQFTSIEQIVSLISRGRTLIAGGSLSPSDQATVERNLMLLRQQALRLLLAAVPSEEVEEVFNSILRKRLLEPEEKDSTIAETDLQYPGFGETIWENCPNLIQDVSTRQIVEGTATLAIVCLHQSGFGQVGYMAREMAKWLGAVVVPRELPASLSELRFEIGGVYPPSSVGDDIGGVLRTTCRHSGRLIDILHLYGHSARGYQPWRGGSYAQYLSPNAQAVFHGCEAADKEGVVNNLARHLGEGGRVYAHWEQGMAGRVHEFTEFRFEEGEIETSRLGASTRISEVFPLEYVRYWAQTNSPAALGRAIAYFQRQIDEYQGSEEADQSAIQELNDIVEMMRTVQEQREAGNANE